MRWLKTIWLFLQEYPPRNRMFKEDVVESVQYLTRINRGTLPSANGEDEVVSINVCIFVARYRGIPERYDLEIVPGHVFSISS